MGIVRKTLADLKANPFRFTPEQKARLDAATDEQIEANAESDPDNPPLADEQLERGVFGRDVRRAREKAGLTQEQFAAALGLPVATLRNWEQGRVNPDQAARALIKIVAADPEFSLKVLAAD